VKVFIKLEYYGKYIFRAYVQTCCDGQRLKEDFLKTNKLALNNLPLGSAILNSHN